MPTNKTIDELVDKIVDEALARADSQEDVVKRRRPKPFRYITDREEIKAELAKEEVTQFTVMKDKNAPTKILDDKLAVVGLGNVEAIENVIRRHEASRRFAEK
jgi:hypothetical protein